MTRVVAVRHGETDWNRDGRMQGWAPVPLNETGRKQSKTTGRWLADAYEFDRAFASDLLRTRETTRLLSESIGKIPVTYESAFRERGLGVYQGLDRADIESRFPEFGLTRAAYTATETVPEDGESFRNVETRVIGRFEEFTGDETLLLVTHGGPLCILLGHAKGQELTEALSTHHPDNCAITEFRIDDDGTTIVRENVTAPDRS